MGRVNGDRKLKREWEGGGEENQRGRRKEKRVRISERESRKKMNKEQRKEGKELMRGKV